MPINTDRNYGQALTMSVAQRSSTVRDIIYDSTPLTRILKDEGRIQTKRAGGPELRIPVEYDKLSAQWFTGYDKIAITPKELVNSAVFNWSRVVAPFSLNGTEMLFNSNEEEIIDLMSFYISAAERSAKEEFESSMVGDGTADGGRQMIGFGGSIPTTPNTGTYGGINRADVAEWRTSFFDVSDGDVTGYTTWDSTTARGIISKITLDRSRGSQRPDLWIFDSNMWESVEASFVAHQRFTSDRMTRLGLSGLSYMTGAGAVDLVAAGGIGNVMPANTAFGIDTSSFSIYEFPGQSFVPFHPGDGMRPVNQDAMAQGIVWTGQPVVENPLSMVRLQV
ncbi:MAG: putative major head protein [Prokaryotic dsDNA virus sp.]|jgi:hypothetical protein|nr:MAG: putative major head protein [Prokaryotic dsDNA virus sp.]|tara:strand:- start:5818 stop:6825 length:1008 start_codon:yes stop_codon:yes gene_type:complete